MQARITAAKILGLGLLYRLYHLLRYELHIVVDAGKMLHRVEQEGRTRPEQVARLSRDNRAVGKLDSRAGTPRPLGPLAGSPHGAAVVNLNLRLFEQEGNLVDLGLVAVSSSLIQKPTMFTPISVGDL